jgi:Niemann-Pick C1 protein
VFYVFFEQYLFIIEVAWMNLGLALAGIFLVTLLLMRNPWLSLLTVTTVAMIETGLVGSMALWDISLNAVSVVNMVMAIGISVEFCVHIAYAFETTPGTRNQRVKYALTEVSRK